MGRRRHLNLVGVIFLEPQGATDHHFRFYREALFEQFERLTSHRRIFGSKVDAQVGVAANQHSAAHSHQSSQFGDMAAALVPDNSGQFISHF
mgnify:CR=1 FL=1